MSRSAERSPGGSGRPQSHGAALGRRPRRLAAASRRRTAQPVVALALGLALGFASAQPLSLRVAEATGPISPHAITGFNVGIAMAVALNLEEFAAIDLRSLRYPPGNDADDRPLTADMMDAIRVTWRLLGEPDLHLMANFFEGPEHAVAAARYLRELGMLPRWWAVGNEPDLYPRNRMDPSWTAEAYCGRFREFRSALEAELGDVRMTGPAVSNSHAAALEYLREVITRCGDVIDVLTWHVYPTDGTASDEDALATSRDLGGVIQRVRGWLADPAINPLGHERDIRLGVTEFGLSWRSSTLRHLEDMIAALWLAETLGQLATSGVDLGQYFALHSMGGHGLIDRSGWVRHTYHVFAMLRGFAGEARRVLGGDERLGAYAADDGEALRLLLVNRSLDAIDVRLDLGTEQAAELDVLTLDDAIFDEELGPRASQQSSAATVHVPARAVVVLTSWH
jgi:hypothetical protein